MQKEPKVHIPSDIELDLKFNIVDGIIYSQSNESANKFELIQPKGKINVANTLIMDAMFSLMPKGTKNHNSIEIKKKLDSLGAFVQPSLGNAHSGISLYCLSENYSDSVEFVQYLLQNPSFLDSELDVWKDKSLQSLKHSFQQVSYVAKRNLMEHLYQNKYLGNYWNEESIKSLSRNDLLSSHKESMSMTWSASAISSSEPELIIPTKEFRLELGPIPVIEESVHLKEDWDHAEQTALRIVYLIPGFREVNYYEMSIINIILGGYFGSRLMKRIREDLGLTYGIHSTVQTFSNYSLLVISGEVKKGSLSTVMKEIQQEIAKLAQDGVADTELNIVKNYVLGKLLKQVDGNFSQMEMIQNYLWTNRDLTEFSRFQTTLMGLSTFKIQELVTKYLLNNNKIVSSVG
jgi:zinc protease